MRALSSSSPAARHRHCALSRAVQGCVALLLVASPAVGDMRIDRVEIDTRVRRVDGVAVAAPYTLSIVVHGAGIEFNQVRTPSGTLINLAQVSDGVWAYEWPNYLSLNALRTGVGVGFGTFEMEFFGAPQEDRVTVWYDPGFLDPVSGHGAWIAPTHLQQGVGLDPSFEWSCAGVCGSSGWAVWLETASGEPLYDEFLPLDTTEWVPGPIAPQTQYRALVDSVLFLDGTPAVQTTDYGGDPFVYVGSFSSGNEILFTARERIVLSVGHEQLAWTGLTGETSYDALRGDLDLLRGSGGDFAAADVECLANDHPSTTLAYAQEPGTTGEGTWLLVRGATSADGYDTLNDSQAADRDAGLGAAPSSCP